MYIRRAPQKRSIYIAAQLQHDVSDSFRLPFSLTCSRVYRVRIDTYSGAPYGLRAAAMIYRDRLVPQGSLETSLETAKRRSGRWSCTPQQFIDSARFDTLSDSFVSTRDDLLTSCELHIRLIYMLNIYWGIHQRNMRQKRNWRFLCIKWKYVCGILLFLAE